MVSIRGYRFSGIPGTLETLEFCSGLGNLTKSGKGLDRWWTSSTLGNVAVQLTSMCGICHHSDRTVSVRWHTDIVCVAFRDTLMMTRSSQLHSSSDSASGRFVKQEQWERWRAKRKLVCGSEHWVGWGEVAPSCCGGLPPEKFSTVYAKSCKLMHFGRKTVRKSVHNMFLNALTMGMLFPCILAAFQQWERRSHAFPLRNDPGRCCPVAAECCSESMLRCVVP